MTLLPSWVHVELNVAGVFQIQVQKPHTRVTDKGGEVGGGSISGRGNRQHFQLL